MQRTRRRAARATTVATLLLLATFALVPARADAAPPVVHHFTATVTDTNLVTLDWQVSGASSNLLYIYDLGFRPVSCPGQQPSGCSTSFRVGESGVRRYTLSVRNGSEFTNVVAEVDVPKLSPPQVAAARVHVDMLDPQDQTLAWTHPASGPIETHFVQVRPHGSFRNLGQGSDGLPGTHFPLDGSHPVTVDDLPDVGAVTWSVSYCIQPVAGQKALCSTSTEVTFAVEPAQLDGPSRRFAPVGQDLALSWSGSGNWWYVSSPSLGVSQWTTTPSITIPGASVTAGVHDVEVTSCIWGGGCSNRVDVVAPAAGTVDQLVDHGTGTLFTPAVATVTPTGGDPIDLQPSRPGTYYHAVADGATVADGDLVGIVITSDVDSTQVIVGDEDTASWTERELGDDFAPTVHDVSTRSTIGSPLDITIDSAGDPWVVGEFGTSVGHLDGTSLTHHVAPIGRTLDPRDNTYPRTKPFISSFNGQPTATPALVERVIDTGSAIWWTQAGDYTEPDNHNVLIRFDRTASDDPGTAEDDRLCAVHVPGEANMVIGLAHDPATNRIWFTEGANSGNPPALNWFVDGDLDCDNGLQYQTFTSDGQGGWVETRNDAAIDAAAADNRCTSPSETGCIHRIDLPAAAGSPGHLVVDQASGSLWIASWTGQAISRHPLTGGGTASVETFPIPNPVEPGFFQGFPWQLRVDGDAVYVIEYSDNQLLRLDKGDALSDPACKALVAGENPCIDELFLPYTGDHQSGHSVALRDGKLWFTMSDEGRGTDAPEGAYIGYVDTASWAAGTPTGVIYTDLMSLGPPPTRATWSPRGIEVGSDGTVVFADMARAVVELSPI